MRWCDEGDAHVRQGPDCFYRRLEVLRRSSGRQQNQFENRSRHHQPRRSERFGQDHLDEPLNALDPMARAEPMALLQKLAENGSFVIVSSHILHEVDIISDSVIMMSNGYIVAEGEIHDVRGEMAEHPLGIRIRCDKPG